MDSPSKLIRNILSNTLHKIRVIGGTKSNRPRRGFKDKPISIENKFKNRVEPGTVLDLKCQIKVPENDAKVENEIAFLQDILEELIVIVSTGGEYQEINGILDCLVDEFKEECAIVERYECNKKLYRYLDNKLKKDKEEFKDKLLKCDEKIFDLENEIKEVEMENTIKLKLVVKWEEARREQTQSMFQEAKSEYQKRIARALSNYEKEERIFNEVELFIRKEIENNLAEKINWKEKYERESSDLDEDIKLAKVKIEKTQDKIQELRENYIRRNIEIQSYLQQKQQMEEARRLEKQKWDSAVRIQAWWRGTMYRNGLGPYRRKKKPKKGGKTGKK